VVTIKTPFSIALQMGVIAMVCGALTLATAGLRPSPWNAAWMLGLPVLIATVANGTAKFRVIMAVGLTLWSVASITATAVLFRLSY
jgi:hypothetical protein